MRPMHQGRLISNLYGILRQQLNNMKQDERKQFSEGVAKALRARTAKEDDSAEVRGKAGTKLYGGTCTETEAVFDTGCTHPITTKTLTEGMKKKIEVIRY